MKILLTLGYDGTNYGGWQRQINAVTVQEKLEHALCALYEKKITVTGASRTDAKVHALGQRAAFEAENPIPLNRLPTALNAKLPDDIRVFAAEEVGENFHAIFGAKRKTYEYKIYNGKIMSPLIANFACHEDRPLDLAAIKEAAGYFVGQHDFKAFCASGSGAKTTVREIYCLNVTSENSIVTIKITGNGFLYNMVRIIAGTLIYAGLGKLAPAGVPAIIESKDRTKAGKTAPPQGLTLMSIEY